MNIFHWFPGWTERDRTLGISLQNHYLTLFKTQHNISGNVLILLMQNYLPCFYFLSLGLVTLGSTEWGINFHHFAAKVLENPWTQGMSWHSRTITKEVTLGGVEWWRWGTFLSYKLGSRWLGGGGHKKIAFFSFFTLTPFLIIKILAKTSNGELSILSYQNDSDLRQRINSKGWPKFSRWKLEFKILKRKYRNTCLHWLCAKLPIKMQANKIM